MISLAFLGDFRRITATRSRSSLAFLRRTQLPAMAALWYPWETSGGTQLPIPWANWHSWNTLLPYRPKEELVKISGGISHPNEKCCQWIRNSIVILEDLTWGLRSFLISVYTSSLAALGEPGRSRAASCWSSLASTGDQSGTKLLALGGLQPSQEALGGTKQESSNGMTSSSTNKNQPLARFGNCFEYGKILSLYDFFLNVNYKEFFPNNYKSQI